MSKKMLIEATHAEATRVVVLENGRLEELDVDTSTKKQIKGNIYLAKIVRVEPSLQAAFVDYGGNRHGFLAFGEIHPDYYQIPTADREKLKEMMADQQAEKQEELEEDAVPDKDQTRGQSVLKDASDTLSDVDETFQESLDEEAQAALNPAQATRDNAVDEEDVHPKTALEVVSESETEDVAPKRPSFFKRYKIQEVIRQGQVMLIQVVKEERGNKGAALTTYLSLAGRYSVLMPNNGKGGGVSRKITNAKERKELRAIVDSLPIPQGMSVIIRTAGSGKKKTEIKRDYDYLIKTWMKIRDNTLESMAPKLIHEEGDIIKRSLRDGFTPDIEEIWVEGDAIFKSTKEFMKILMPGQVKKIKQYKGDIPMFQAYQVENQLEAIHSNVVQLKSGGYIVIDQTEALVAVDVNSGRATKERDIEETALRTNLETCDELARQLKLRDLAGLIVIDFIDMDEARNNSAVERRLKDALKKDRARIQVGKISGFGLMEMSRQRLHSSFLESSYKVCTCCGGKGVVRLVESCATRVMYLLQEAANRNPNTTLVMTLPLDVATYVLNQKRDYLSQLEGKYSVVIQILADPTLEKNTDYKLERLRENGERATVQLTHHVPKEQREKADKNNKVPKEQAKKDDGKKSTHAKAEKAQDKGTDETPAGEGTAGETVEDTEKSNRRRDRNRRRREWKKNKRLARKMAQAQNQEVGENKVPTDEEGTQSLPAVREEGHNAVAEVTDNTPMIPFEENFTVVEQAHIGEVEEVAVQKRRGRKPKANVLAAKEENSTSRAQTPHSEGETPAVNAPQNVGEKQTVPSEGETSASETKNTRTGQEGEVKAKTGKKTTASRKKAGKAKDVQKGQVPNQMPKATLKEADEKTDGVSQTAGTARSNPIKAAVLRSTETGGSEHEEVNVTGAAQTAQSKAINDDVLQQNERDDSQRDEVNATRRAQTPQSESAQNTAADTLKPSPKPAKKRGGWWNKLVS